jgi:hypothetical protein
VKRQEEPLEIPRISIINSFILSLSSQIKTPLFLAAGQRDLTL